MSEHRAAVRWSRGDHPFTYQDYAREHEVTFGGGSTITVSAAPEFLGKAECANPEELLVAALSSCHMLTFLAIAARRGLTVDTYDDEADGLLAKNKEGTLSLTLVTIRPRITWHGLAPDPAAIAEMHLMSHRGCFIANSVKTEVRIAAR